MYQSVETLNLHVSGQPHARLNENRTADMTESVWSHKSDPMGKSSLLPQPLVGLAS